MTTHRCEDGHRGLHRRIATVGMAATVVLAALLGGCGQLGPLYLPPPASEVITRPAADASSSTTATSPAATPAETRTP